MSQPISIIVPVYNVGPYLDVCLESIVNQTYRNLEIIVVNDGSSDQSQEICERWSNSDERICVINLPNLGVATARNRGIERASGAYLYFVDGDDYIADNLCQRVMECFEQFDPDIVRFGFCYDKDSNIHCEQDPNPVGMIDPHEAVRRLLTGEYRDYVWNKFYKRKIFDNIRFPDGKVFEDIGTAYQCFLAAERIYSINEPLYYYRQRKGSLSQTFTSQALCNIFEIRMSRHEIVKQIYPDLAETDLEIRASIARSVVERSWYEPIDSNTVSSAVAFLRKQKSNLVHTTSCKRLRAYYRFPMIYRIYRTVRYKFSKRIKSLYAGR